MATEFNIRAARPDDASVLVEFNRAIARETENRELPLEVVSNGVEALLDDANKGFYVIAENDGVIAGTLMVTNEWSDWRNGMFWWIQSVYVKAEFRRRGVYRLLYNYVREQADSSPGVCGFRLYVERDNVAAQKTYESLGMHETVYKMYEEAKA